LQQSVFEAITVLIKQWADDAKTGRYDLRNEHTVKTAEKIAEAFKDELGYVPCI
jgi:hypothetical protein